MTGLKLRDYQDEAIIAVRDAWARGVQRPAVVLPTGTGKTVAFAALAALEKRRTVVLVHRDELIRQTVAKVRAVAGLEAGVVKAAQNETDKRIIVASVQTLASGSRLEAMPRGATVIVDECHHATAVTYRRAIDHLTADDGRAVGFTATMERGDGQALGDVWQEIVYTRSILEMIRAGHLTDVAGYRVEVADLDFSAVKKTRGDFSEADLGHAIEESAAPEVVARAYVEFCAGELKPAILFAPTVDTAHLFRDAMRAEGVRAESVWGAMPIEERRDVLRKYDRGEIDVLCNCMVLTEGFDSPRAEICIVARPTASAPLFVQMVGRVLRPFPGKKRATVLDVVGATGVHELVTLAKLGGLRAEPKQGTSVLEAWDEEEEHREERERQYREGRGELFEVDLFGGSRQRWLKTHDGWWFLPGLKRFIAIQPNADGDGWDVASWAMPKGGKWIAQAVPDIELAMSLGEADITFEEEMTASKERSWRKKKATAKQLAYLATLLRKKPDEIDIQYGSCRAGEVGDVISVVLGSRRIDGPLKRWIA